MITEPKVGDRVWVCYDGKCIQYKIRVLTGYREGIVCDLYTPVSFHAREISRWDSECFPTKEALLQHLSDTAVEYKP